MISLPKMMSSFKSHSADGYIDLDAGASYQL